MGHTPAIVHSTLDSPDGSREKVSALLAGHAAAAGHAGTQSLGRYIKLVNRREYRMVTYSVSKDPSGTRCGVLDLRLWLLL